MEGTPIPKPSLIKLTQLMKNKLIIAFLLCATQIFAQIPTKRELIFSAVKGTESKVDSLSFEGAKNKVVPSISGEGKDFFKIIAQHKVGKKESILIGFSPAIDFIGISQATLLVINSVGKTISSITLKGLSLKGIEGENEASLESIVKILGYPINVGWTTLANNSNPILQGDEIATGTFQKVGEGKVEMIPVARFSPNFELPFGYYTNSPQGLQQHQVGILAKTKKTLKHSTLFPALTFGGTSFDPKNNTFGFYSIGLNHTVYSSDVWNQLYYAENVAHGTRIYPVKNQANTYLVCFEEAKNGDYNDYVFLVKNIKPVKESFTNLFNGKDLAGWNSFLQGKGVVVNIGDNASAKNGSILLQSEYAEVYYRNAKIRELK